MLYAIRTLLNHFCCRSYHCSIFVSLTLFRESLFFILFLDRLLLERFYLCMYMNVEETKKLIETNYAIRNKCPHIFIERDPTDDDSRRTFEYA